MKKDTRYKLNIKNQADRYIIRLSKKNNKDFEMLLENIKKIPQDPYNSKPLHNNFKGLRRVRKGDYRIIFRINESMITILIIGKRNNVYKKR